MTNDNYATPKEFYAQLDAEFHFNTTDDCPINDNQLRAFDGLATKPNLNGVSKYVNPPYSNPTPWIEKAIKDSELGATSVMLLRCDTSTKWFHELVLPFAKLRFVKGRLRFNGEPAPFASLIAIFYPMTVHMTQAPAIMEASKA